MLLAQLAIGRFMVKVLLQSHNCSVRSQSTSSHSTRHYTFLYDLGLQLGLKLALEVEITVGILVGGRRFIHGLHSRSGASPSRWDFKWDSAGTC